MGDTKFKFQQIKDAVTLMKRDLPVQLASQALNYFVDAFDKQGFDGQPWKDVQRHDTGTTAYKYPIRLRARKLSSPVLVGVYKGRSGGTLRRAVSRSIRQVSFRKIVLQVKLPYAAAQNEGTATIPARPFMAKSKELTAMHRATIKAAMDACFKK